MYNLPSLPHCPGAINLPSARASCFHPPARAAPPDCSAYFCIRASSSGRKWRMRPWMGQANASPRAADEIVSTKSVKVHKQNNGSNMLTKLEADLNASERERQGIYAKERTYRK